MNTKTKITEPSDKLIPELERHAVQAIKTWQENARMTPVVFFKHTCGLCGQRGFIDKHNAIPREVECGACGATEPYDKGGYSLAFELAGTKPHGFTANATARTLFTHPNAAMVQKSAPQLNPRIPMKIGCRAEKDQSITPIDKEALLQFCATLAGQGMFKKGGAVNAEA